MSDCDPICEETLKALEVFLDGELAREVRVEVEAHLSGCNPCTKHAEFRRYVKVLVSTKCVEHDVPPELAARIQQLIASPAPPD
jgi:mycothiol system anti-sigma-R factor